MSKLGKQNPHQAEGIRPPSAGSICGRNCEKHAKHWRQSYWSIPLPTNKTLYTILRSPHVDKKSQDQFQMLVHKRLIDIMNPTQQTTNALKKLSLPAGVHVEIKANTRG